MSAGLSALEQLLAYSEAMLGAAESRDWQALARHEADRRALADSLPDALSAELPAEEQQRARALIESSLRCDTLIQPRLARRMDELRVLLRAAAPAAE
ncbi:flagellar protein FliT [Candidatus Accumulibacter phosphatis]|jgi:hypothetical protein|uniref:Flagellar protein FliT n=1 Tax=Candidatus Accumulibacter phosphatis TaxID=327160 RepID=A0ABX1TUK6_9PROT|nr:MULTISPECIES: flagellar protein FliT [Candidatus Accumulibacter]NMQ27900.1 flagellar protein FliT [Candidatus Accumulibacter phosphatis]